MTERDSFTPNPDDPQWEVKYWAGTLDSYHGSIYIGSAVTPLDYRGSHRRKPGLPYFSLRVRLPEVNGLNYPALLSHQFGASAYLSEGSWEMSTRKALIFLQMVEPHLFIKRLRAQLGIEFQKDTAHTNKLPSSERTAYRLTIGETYYLKVTNLNRVEIYDQSRFNVPDQLDPAYVIGIMEHGLRPRVDARTAGRITGLVLEWRSKKAAERVQAYFGGSVADITGEGFRNDWGIEDGRELLAQVQPYFKLRLIVDLEEPFRSSAMLRELFKDYHRGVVNLAAASISPRQKANLTGDYVVGMKQCLDELGLAEYTEKSQQQADRILSFK